MKVLPGRRERALDVGCGNGDFAALLAERFDRVDAIDRSPEAIAWARAHCPAVRFIEGDFMTAELGRYDYVSALASLHHLPMRPTLSRMKALLRPGGVLAILGLWRAATLRDYATSAIAFPISCARRRNCDGPPVVLREPELTLAEIRAVVGELLPGATLRRHLLWRYSLVWVQRDSSVTSRAS